MAPVDRKARYRPLLVSLLFLSLVVPLFEDLAYGTLVIDVVSTSVLVSGAWTASHRPRDLVIMIALAAMVVGTQLLGLWLDLRAANVLSAIVTVGFVGCVTIMLLSDLMQATQISADTIGGAICGYMMIGITWGSLFFVIQLFEPRAFNLPEAARPTFALFQSEYLQLIYYSMVTLTTVGYGDISAKIPLAQNLSSLEAMIGQFYIAVLVARLVSLQMTQRTRAD
jgi:voltage-gated potassium channel